MEELSKLVANVGSVWGWLVAACGMAVAGHRVWRRRSGSIRRALRLSDQLHDHYGVNVAESLVAELHKKNRDGAIRELRTQLLEDKSGSAVFVSGADGRCEFANGQLAEMFGLDAHEFIGNGWLEAIDSDERLEVHEHWIECVTRKVPYRREYTVVNQRTGHSISCVARAYPAVLVDGTLLGFVGIVDRRKSPRVTKVIEREGP